MIYVPLLFPHARTITTFFSYPPHIVLFSYKETSVTTDLENGTLDSQFLRVSNSTLIHVQYVFYSIDELFDIVLSLMAFVSENKIVVTTAEVLQKHANTCVFSRVKTKH